MWVHRFFDRTLFCYDIDMKNKILLQTTKNQTLQL